MYRISKNDVREDGLLSLDILTKYLAKHRADVTGRLTKLRDAYMTDFAIFHQPAKASHKPDNRIAVNFAKYTVDEMVGFFAGTPIRYKVDDDEKAAEYVEFLKNYNLQEDTDAELAKLSDIYGTAYEMIYVNEVPQICTAKVSPLEGFMIYDEGIVPKPLFFVHVYTDTKGTIRGSYSNSEVIQYFSNDDGLRYDGEPIPHYFGTVPAVEYAENDERTGIFEPVMSMIDAYNKAISEKANDVDYFADAYMKILGAHLEEGDIAQIRSNRVINFDGDGASNLVVDFMQKPSADATQENLIDRLERMIYTIAQVVNISDDSFGTSSGIALRYKLLPMMNIANVKERKFRAAMANRYRIIFANPLSGMDKDAWTKIDYIFTRNFPPDVESEVNAARNVEGIVTKETQIGLLSFVQDPAGEAEKVESLTALPAMV